MFTLLAVLQLSNDNDAHWRGTTTGFIATCLYVFYTHFYLLTQHAGKRKGKDYRLQFAVIALTGPLPFVLFYHKTLDFGQYSMHLVTTVPIFLFLSWLARVTENLVLNTIRKEQLEKQAVQAELYYLKSQINPHFLFNTLNNIHTLVYKQAATAPEAVLRLASLMRYMIYESNSPTVPLSREMDYLQDYIGLQQLRYKQAPVVDLQIQGDPAACHIAPLLFVHLLENAYKHSPARLEPGAIRVSVEVAADSLHFRVENPVAPNPARTLEEPGGIGLPNIRKRLQLLYPEQHQLDVSRTGDTFTVLLIIYALHLPVHEREYHLLHH
ncbi:sensor histidine kinase [Hymenobacter koreensis]|uniref:sensor histidine kinase n=1 Tax=Hymenobacter koreensis TaxID=1084523 RepID=UPI0031E77B8B